MKITNTSLWNTEDLVKLVEAGVEEFPSLENRKEQLVVDIKRNWRIAGQAELGGSKVELFFPVHAEPIQMAWVLMHELDHIVGLNHSDMETSFFADFHSSEELMNSNLMEWSLPYLNIGRK